MDDASVTPQVTHPPPVERFRRWGIVAWSIIGVLILAGVVVWALTRVGEIFPPLVLALLTIYVLNPVVSRLERRGVRRLLGSCVTYIMLMAVVAIAVALLVPTLVDQGQQLAKELPDTIDRITRFASGVSRTIRDRFGASIDIHDWIGSNSALIRRGVLSAGTFLRGAAQTFALLLIGMVLGFYLLVDLPRLQRATVRLFPPDRREEVTQVASSVATAMGGFFRGQLFVALIVGIMSAVAMRIIGLPYWLVVGMIAGFFNLVPLIGPFIGAIPAILIAAAFKPPITMLWVALLLTGVQQIDNHFISPNVMRVTVRLHPVTVMISLTAGATLAGFWGMLVAVPLVASAKMIAAHFWLTRIPWGTEVFEDTGEMEALGAEQRAPPEVDRQAAEQAATSPIVHDIPAEPVPPRDGPWSA